MTRPLAMTDDEPVALNWLDTVAHDLDTFKSFVAILEVSVEVRKVVVYKELVGALLARLRGLLDVLVKLQQQTNEILDVTLPQLAMQDMRELVVDLVLVVYRLRTFLEHFGQEQPLCQFIRNRKLIECLSTYWCEQADAESQALQKELAAHNQHAHDPGACEQSAGCRLFKDATDLEVSSKTASTFAFETQRGGRPAHTSEVRVTPWFLPSDSIRLDEHIGNGECGEVWRGTLGMTTEIAIKRLFVRDRDDAVLTQIKRAAYEREVLVWQQLNHPHILQFYGATAFGADCSIVSELAPYGKLYDYWTISGFVDPARKQDVWCLLFQAALGLQHMHERGLIHGDLKCDNIFVGDDAKAKIADLGLSFMISNHENVPCTEAANWLAPECLDKEPKRPRTFATDVFMFGMCIVEALIGGPPWGTMSKGQIRYHLFRKCALPEVIERLAPAVQELVFAMCRLEPDKRISMDEVVERLKVFEKARDPKFFVGTKLE